MLRNSSPLETNRVKQIKAVDEELERELLLEEKHHRESILHIVRRVNKHLNMAKPTLIYFCAKSGIRRDMTVYSTVQNSQNSFQG